MLRVEFGEEMIEIGIETAFVAVVPKQNAGVVHVASNHFAHERRADGVIIKVVPTGQLIEHVEAEFIAELEKFLVRGIMGHADGVDVGVLHGVDVQPVDGFAEAAAGVRPEGVAIDAFQNHAPAIEIKAIAVADFERAEAKALAYLMDDFTSMLETEFDGVEVGSFGSPKPGRSGLCFERSF